MTEIVVLVHNIRSTFNIGSIFRTCDGFGVKEIIFSGYSPYPTLNDDDRLPHVSQKLTSQIAKTALGAEKLVPFRYSNNIESTINSLKSDGYTVIGLEQTENSHKLQDFRTLKISDKVALLIGEEVNGINSNLVKLCNLCLEIDMFGKKESFNVSVATGIALYEMTRQK